MDLKLPHLFETQLPEPSEEKKLKHLDIAKVNIHINNVCVVDGGERSKTYTEDEGKKVMMEDEIILKVSLKRGVCCEEVWTTDLSYEYVKINSEYRS